MFYGNQVIKVLIVDDDEDDFILTQDVISEISGSKYQVDWESNYDKALDKICSQTYDIYIVDYFMGAHTALDVLQEVKNKEVTSPIIILTGKESKESDVQLMQAGASDYLIKSELTAAIIERSIRYAISNTDQLKRVRENEQKFRAIFEESVDAILLCSNGFEILDANNSFLELFNYTKDEIIGSSIVSVFENSEDSQDFQNRILNSEAIDNTEVLLATKDKHRLECQIASVPIRLSNGDAGSHQVVIHDLTLRKKAERELIQAELLSVTGKMARSMAHEVRNPLTNLVLALNQLEDEVDEENEGAMMLMDIINRNSKRIDQIITTMLNTSRGSVIQRKEVNLKDVIEGSIQNIRDRLTLKNMDLQLDLDQADVVINIDPEQFKISLNNLFVNAVEAMVENEGVLEVSVQAEDEYVLIYIKDNGMGMNTETANKLFNPFFTSKKGGMGLGLTTVSNIINAHHGTISISSSIGNGAKFKITLPL